MFIQFIAILALLWGGMILGISLESWAKFHTPSLTKAVGLDVGRTVFRFFHKAQMILMIVLLGLALLVPLSIANWIFLFLLLAMLATQIFWLFPQLDKRTNLIIVGEAPPPSRAHAYYGATEIVKFVILLALSINLLI